MYCDDIELIEVENNSYCFPVRVPNKDISHNKNEEDLELLKNNKQEKPRRVS